ncbi:MAG: lipopolysaccharide heptosyltransferase II [Bacteroidetes bacterium]|nr:MAG: lipopolysaccharide heptosyltransferase II [Bacteroidota bacterium]
MPECTKVLVVQTAFLGDVVLTLPLIQELKRHHPDCLIDVVVVPRCAEALENHPDIHKTIMYDKRGMDKGIQGLLKMAKHLRQQGYDLALVPHRSLRSAVLTRIAGIPVRIGFNTSAGRWLFTKQIEYRKNLHEVDRNLELLKPLEIIPSSKALPALYPSDEDVKIVDLFLATLKLLEKKFIAIAPGTVWNTKRWLRERFIELAKKIIEQRHNVILVGGKEDRQLSEEIISYVQSEYIASCVGKLTILQSAELIRRSAALVSNDSAPMHLAVAMRTPVVAIFGATVPEFGFAPRGERDVVIETTGLSCRPCSIHGGEKCPITTFECMKQITVERVMENVERITSGSNARDVR